MKNGNRPGAERNATGRKATMRKALGRKATMRKALARNALAGSLALAAVIGPSTLARADEGGVSFWIPGFFGSLAASPLVPGFSMANIYYHTSVKAGPDVAFARQVTRGNINVPFTGNLNVSLRGDADLLLAVPSYTFADRWFLGGQATILVAVPYGRSKASVDATLTGSLGIGPGFTISGGRSDEITGFGDLVPMFNVRWNAGVHNYMTYVTTNLTVGRYDPKRLANLGIGHNAIDGGFGYTYLDEKTGWEASAVLGFTYNFENEHTQYKNGVDMHLDWGVSRFLTKQLQVGVAGYAYQQISCDSGAGNRVGCFESRVFGAGPQIGYIQPLGTEYQAYFNLKGYKEFASEHRPDGWNVWFTVSLSPAEKKPEQSTKKMTMK